VLEQATLAPWFEGDKRIRRLVMLGTPNLGSVTSLERLTYGDRMAVRTVPVEVMATFVTPFQALPHRLSKAILDPLGRPVDLDLFDPPSGADASGRCLPEVSARVRESMTTPPKASRRWPNCRPLLHNLHRADRLQRALNATLPARNVEIAVFGGDCEPTSDMRCCRMVRRIAAGVSSGQVVGPEPQRQPGEKTASSTTSA
jgi:hypothetical protein